MNEIIDFLLSRPGIEPFDRETGWVWPRVSVDVPRQEGQPFGRFFRPRWLVLCPRCSPRPLSPYPTDREERVLRRGMPPVSMACYAYCLPGRVVLFWIGQCHDCGSICVDCHDPE